MDVSQSFNIDTLLLEIFVVLKWVIAGVEVLVWWSMVLVKGSVRDSILDVGTLLPAEVSLTEKTISWDPVVVWCWLKIIGV